MRFRQTVIAKRNPRAAALGIACVAALALPACGEDDFENDPRPPSPIELTAAIDKQSVIVAPAEFGAGLITVTISNQTDEDTQLVIEGPNSASSNEIPPGGTGTIKVSLEEGTYEASAGDELGIEPATLVVGPERPSSQNELLLP